jgi:hypothetical protein
MKKSTVEMKTNTTHDLRLFSAQLGQLQALSVASSYASSCGQSSCSSTYASKVSSTICLQFAPPTQVQERLQLHICGERRNKKEPLQSSTVLQIERSHGSVSELTMTLHYVWYNERSFPINFIVITPQEASGAALQPILRNLMHTRK